MVAGSTIHGMRHSSDARHLLRELDAELLAVSNRTGRSLVWTPQDRAVLELIADTVDRRVDLAPLCAAAANAPSTPAAVPSPSVAVGAAEVKTRRPRR